MIKSHAAVHGFFICTKEVFIKKLPANLPAASLSFLLLLQWVGGGYF
jgi:hypothetical protein